MRQRLRLDGCFSCLLAKRVRWASAPCASAPRRAWSRAHALVLGNAVNVLRALFHGGQLLNIVDIEKGPVPFTSFNRDQKPFVLLRHLAAGCTGQGPSRLDNSSWSRAHLSCLEFGNERIVYRASRRPGAAGRGRACHSWHCFTEAGCRVAPLNRIRTNGCAYSCA
jgi:hypothetical protein